MNINKGVRIFLSLIILVPLLIQVSYAINIQQIPDYILVAVTNFTDVEKSDCNATVFQYGGGTQPGLDNYINNRIIEGNIGFYLKNVSFNTYVKDVLPNEWLASWLDESLKSGAMVAKLAAWNTINSYPNKKWVITDADVVDFTCDQTYKNNSNNQKTNQIIDNTWYYYVLYNGSGTDQILSAQYIDGDYSNKKYGGIKMAQNGSQYFAQQGKPYEWILPYYYDNIALVKNINLGDSVSANIAGNSTWKYYFTSDGKTNGFKVDLSESPDKQLTILNPDGSINISDVSFSYVKSLTVNKPQAGNSFTKIMQLF